ncbi:MAG: DEAD/DEAH box helicase [Dehalococcoidia bacterium]|nr:DEAD/DEAH box helicase [Dehalococcoidia bacterium]
MAADLVAALARRGITEPFPVQAATLPDAIAGRDVCGKARTGSGKTLAFGLPLLMRARRSEPKRPCALVLVPTRELASQIVDNLAPLAESRRLRIAPVVGGVSLFSQRQRLRVGVDIVVATPGRLHDLLERGDASVDDVRMVVLDEADQMADFGFLPQVRRILDRIPVRPQTLLFSATLDGEVDALVKRYQREPVFHEVVPEEDAGETMLHRFLGVSDEEKVRVTAAIAAGPERTLLFVRTQRSADRLARQLEREGIEAGVLHGGLSQPRRERALKAFADGTAPVLVATNIAARGIHVDGVDIVVHHDPPEDVKTYLHRSGRTARAGASGMVVTLVSPEQVGDVNLLRRQAGVREAIVPVDAGDPRLADLAAWTPPLEEHRPQPAKTARPAGARAAARRPRPERAPASIANRGGEGQRGGARRGQRSGAGRSRPR